jgi:DNA mismatch repair protein MutS2
MIKLYGLATTGVENAATAFDDTGLKPLYKLQYGVIGQSRAFEILRSVDFPPDIVSEAENIASNQKGTSLAKAMDEISHASAIKLQAEEELHKASLIRAEAEEGFQEMERQKIGQSLRYKRLMDRVEVLTSRPHAKKEIEEVRVSPEARELEEVYHKVEPAKALSLEKGATVLLKGMNTQGIVAEISHDHAEVILGQKRLKVGIDQIEPIEKDEKEGPRVRMKVKASSGYVLPVNVVGMRVDEALPVIERAVDKALLSGQETIEIIHGAGTGRLKSGIREFLKGIPAVKKISDSPMNEGGGNKTKVQFDT